MLRWGFDRQRNGGRRWFPYPLLVLIRSRSEKDISGHDEQNQPRTNRSHQQYTSCKNEHRFHSIRTVEAKNVGGLLVPPRTTPNAILPRYGMFGKSETHARAFLW
mmetsp:Transcript_21214/g.46284  ORF Transcript_21214/g.46284 Transcript_21214/m.46284 type:complete len:105 (-) Transcript_21214:137-451(-)